MLMAIFVFLGFGALYFLVFDESVQGGDRSIESVIRDQGREIESLKARIEEQGQQLARGEGRIGVAKELAVFARENQFREGTLDGLRKDVAKQQERIVEAEAVFAAYQDEYRVYERGRAKGETMDLIVTQDGTEFHDVTIREVTAVGMQIVHRDGHKRILFEELPTPLQDRFQFSAEQKQAALVAEAARRAAHDADAGAAIAAQDAKKDEHREKQRAEERAKLEREIALKEARIVAISSEMRSIEQEISDAQARAAAARAAGRQFIDRSGNLRGKLQSRQNEQNNLRREIIELQAKM